MANSRTGPGYYEEIEALSIITDLTSSLGGNSFTTYYAWNLWRERYGATGSSDRNFSWAR